MTLPFKKRLAPTEARKPAAFRGGHRWRQVTYLIYFGALLFGYSSRSFAQKAEPSKPVSNYTLSAGDIVEIQVFREPDLTVRQKISLEGTIKYPLIGIVQVAGLSADLAAGKIAALLDKDYIISPQVSVLVTSYSKRQFVVLGQVMKPGSYTFPDEQTLDLLGAIAVAGGLTPLANTTRVRVTRGTGNDKKTTTVSFNPMVRESKTDRFILQANDVITVEEAFKR